MPHVPEIVRVLSEKRPRKKRVVDRLKANAKEFLHASTYLDDVISKNALQLLPGSVTVLLESVLSVTDLTSNVTSSSALCPSDTEERIWPHNLLAKQNRLFHCLATLLKWADEVEIDLRSAVGTHVLDVVASKELSRELREAFNAYMKSATDYFLSESLNLQHRVKLNNHDSPKPSNGHVPQLLIDLDSIKRSQSSPTPPQGSPIASPSRNVTAASSTCSISTALAQHRAFDQQTGPSEPPSSEGVVLKCRVASGSPPRESRERQQTPSWIKRLADVAELGDGNRRVIDQSERLELFTCPTSTTAENIRTEAKLTRNTVVEIKVPRGVDVREIVRKMSQRLEEGQNDPMTVDSISKSMPRRRSSPFITKSRTNQMIDVKTPREAGSGGDGDKGELDELLEALKLKLIQNTDAKFNDQRTLKLSFPPTSCNAKELVQKLPYPSHFEETSPAQRSYINPDDEVRTVAVDRVCHVTTSRLTLAPSRFSPRRDHGYEVVHVNEERSHDRRSVFYGNESLPQSWRLDSNTPGPESNLLPLDKKETQITTYMKTIGEYSIPIANDFFQKTTEVFFRDIQRHWDNRQSRTPSPQLSFKKLSPPFPGSRSERIWPETYKSPPPNYDTEEDLAYSDRYSSPFYESALYDSISKGTSTNSFSSGERAVTTPYSSLSSLSPPLHKSKSHAPLPNVIRIPDVEQNKAILDDISPTKTTNQSSNGHKKSETEKALIPSGTLLTDIEPSHSDLIFKDDVTSLPTSLGSSPSIHMKSLVKCGSLNALLVYATCPLKNDFLFQEAFILTYGTFSSSRDLVDKLVRRYTYFSQHSTSNDTLNVRAARCCFSFLIRIIDDLSFNEIGDDLLQALMKYQYDLILHGELVLAKILRKKLFDKLAQKTKHNVMPKQNGSFTREPIPISNLTLTDFRSKDLAEQMTYLDAQLFNRLPLSEILTWARTQNDSNAPNLTAFTEHFNNVSYWCRSLILSQTESKLRERYFFKFIKILDKLRSLANFNSYLAILSALDCAPIRRIFLTTVSDWSISSANPVQRKMARMCEILKTRHCSLIDCSGSFKNYRKVIAQTEPPCIPYIGLVLQDLTFINVGNPDETDTGLINFTKRWQYFSVLEGIQKFKKCQYLLKRDDKIISFFNTFNDQLTEDVLWQRSELIKPRH